MIPEKEETNKMSSTIPLFFFLGDTFQIVEQGEQWKAEQHSVELGRRGSRVQEG